MNHINKNILKEGLIQLSLNTQLIIAIEELSELQKEICKDKRGLYNSEHMAEEMSHAIFMIDQLLVVYDNENLVQGYYNKAIQRYKNLLSRGAK